MRKNESIHIHALLAEVTRYLIENEDVSVETLSEYDALETRPPSIHEPKRNHQEAIAILGNAIESWIGQSREENPEQSMGGPR